MRYAERLLADLAGGRTLPWIVGDTTELDQMFAASPEACGCNLGFHLRYGSGEVRYLVRQVCRGCSESKRFWACEGCVATTRRWVTQGCVTHHGRCGYRAPLAEFIASIEAAR